MLTSPLLVSRASDSNAGRLKTLIETVEPSSQEKAVIDKPDDSGSIADRDGQLATEEEISVLLHVVDDVPARVWLATLVGVAERFTWYGNTGPLRTSSSPPLLLSTCAYLPPSSLTRRVLSRELSPTLSRQLYTWRTWLAPGNGFQHCQRRPGCELLYARAGSSAR